MKRLAWLLAGLGIVVGVAWVVRSRRGAFAPPAALTGQNGHALRERRSRSDPEALKALVDGSVSRIGLDLERLKELKSANYKPLMEYLGYIQVQRGGDETLLFVRMKDLDEMAALAGQSREEFLKQFKKLGVLLSMN